jgi:hypothetical protein
VTSKNIYGPKVFLLTKIKPEYSNILYNPDTFPWSLDMFLDVTGCRKTQVLDWTSSTVYFNTSLTLWCAGYLVFEYLVTIGFLHHKVCQWRWFSPGTLVSSINKTDRHDITETL